MSALTGPFKAEFIQCAGGTIDRIAPCYDPAWRAAQSAKREKGGLGYKEYAVYPLQYNAATDGKLEALAAEFKAKGYIEEAATLTQVSEFYKLAKPDAQRGFDARAQEYLSAQKKGLADDLTKPKVKLLIDTLLWGPDTAKAYVLNDKLTRLGNFCYGPLPTSDWERCQRDSGLFARVPDLRLSVARDVLDHLTVALLNPAEQMQSLRHCQANEVWKNAVCFTNALGDIEAVEAADAARAARLPGEIGGGVAAAVVVATVAVLVGWIRRRPTQAPSIPGDTTNGAGETTRTSSNGATTEATKIQSTAAIV